MRSKIFRTFAMKMNKSIRDDFPILSRSVYGRPLVYLDNAATTQKPRQVIEAIADEYYNVNADLHEQSRETVRRFINAHSTTEIVFTRGTTESINLLASSLAKLQNGEDQPEVIVSQMEHHSNIVPWQLNGFQLRVIPMSDDGVLDLDTYQNLFSPHTRMVCVTHVSNVMSTIHSTYGRRYAGDGLRLLCLQRTQNLWTDRYWSTLW